MKAIILVLFVGVLSCSAGLLKHKQYTTITDPTTADNDALNWGWGQVIQKGQSSGKIPQGPITVTSINSMQKATGAGTGYNFDVTGTDNRGTSINAKYSVYVDNKGNMNLNSWNYKTAAAPTAWTNENANQGNADVQNALNYGVQQLLAIGQSNGKIPKSNYSVERLININSRYNNGNKEYQFDVVLSNGFDARVTATFTVIVSANGQNSFGAYNYNVKTGKL